MAIKTSLQKYNAVDTSKEELGVWHSFDGDIEIRIRRLSSKISKNARKEAEKPRAAALRTKETPPEVYDQILIQQIARGVISDWKGVTDEEGNEIPYSGDIAVEIISGDEMKDFRLEVLNLSMTKEAYRAEVVEAAVGN